MSRISEYCYIDLGPETAKVYYYQNGGQLEIRTEYDNGKLDIYSDERLSGIDTSKDTLPHPLNFLIPMDALVEAGYECGAGWTAVDYMESVEK